MYIEEHPAKPPLHSPGGSCQGSIGILLEENELNKSSLVSKLARRVSQNTAKEKCAIATQNVPYTIPWQDVPYAICHTEEDVPSLLCCHGNPIEVRKMLPSRSEMQLEA